MVAKIRDEIYIKEFGVNLRKIRNSKKISMTELANICNIEYRQVSDIELGKINPTISTVKALAQALGLSPKDLFDF